MASRAQSYPSRRLGIDGSWAVGTAGRRGQRSRRRRPGGLALPVVFGQGAGIEPLTAQVFQDRVHDLVIADEGEDLHRSTASGTSQGIDLEDALEELGPTPAARLQGGPGGQFRILAFLGEGTGLGEDAHSAPAGPAVYGVGAVVAHVDLVLVGHMGEEPGEILEPFESMRAGCRSFGLVGDQGDQAFAGIVVQSLECDGRAGGVEPCAPIVDSDSLQAL